MEHLQWLATVLYLVYGGDGSARHNCSCLGPSERFKVIQSLELTLVFPPNIGGCQYLMEHMTVLPDVKNLHLVVIANGHAFAASLFHVLRKCTGIRRLVLQLPALPDLEVFSLFQVAPACLSGCICHQQTNWKTEELLLNNLEEVWILESRGHEHEISFVKRLINCAEVLKRMTITFDHRVTESMVKECCRLFRSCAQSEICFTFYMYQDSTKVLYAPED